MTFVACGSHVVDTVVDTRANYFGPLQTTSKMCVVLKCETHVQMLDQQESGRKVLLFSFSWS